MNGHTTFADTDRIAEYDLKLMDIDAETLGIPDTDYDARITMPSSEFARIVRDLSQLGDTVRIEVTKEGVRFFSEGEAANGNILLKQSETIGKVGGSSKKGDGEEEDDEEDEEGEEEPQDDDEDEDEEDGKKKKKTKAKAKPKKTKTKTKVKKEDGDVEMDEDEGEFKAKSDDEGEDEVEDDDDDESSSKKRKRSAAKVRLPFLLGILNLILGHD